MADWKDRLRPASFRGVAFGVQDLGRSGGRRAGVHEYPLRDTPLVEELGRKVRRYTVDGYLVGDDYVVRLERLISRLEGASAGFPRRPGGTLVHPSFGQIEVLCEDFEVRETLSEGRMARVFMRFVEAGSEIQPFGAVDPVGAADRSSALVFDAGASAYEDGVETSGVIQRALDTIGDTALEASRRLRRLDVFSGSARDVLALEDALTTLVTTISELVTAPADLASVVSVSLDRVLGAASNASGALTAYRALFDLEAEAAQGGGSQALIVASNSRAAVDLWRSLALAGSVRAAARVDWPTLEEALAARAALEALLDELSAGTDDDLVRELQGLRQALHAAVPPPGESLPELREVTLPRATPALVLAHALYSDAERDAEIVARNAVRDPLLVPGGVALSVLSS